MGTVNDQGGDVAQVTPVGELLVRLPDSQVGGGGGTGLTDTQLRATAVPVSGNVGVLGAVEVVNDVGNPLPVSGTVTISNPTTNPETGLAKDGTDGTTPPAVLGAGTGVRGWLRSIYEKLTGTIAVSGVFWQETQPVSGTVTASGPLTDAELRATAVPISGNVGVIGAVEVVNDVGNPLPVSGSFWQATQPVSGPLTDAQLRASRVPIIEAPSTNGVTVTAAAAAIATCTLPAAGVGLFHYITRVEVVLYNTVARVGGVTPVIVTSTNIPGTPAFTFPSAGAVGTTETRVLELDAAPIRSSVANTATTVVGPATASIIWRINVSYYTGA